MNDEYLSDNHNIQVDTEGAELIQDINPIKANDYNFEDIFLNEEKSQTKDYIPVLDHSGLKFNAITKKATQHLFHGNIFVQQQHIINQNASLQNNKEISLPNSNKFQKEINYSKNDHNTRPNYINEVHIHNYGPSISTTITNTNNYNFVLSQKNDQTEPKPEKNSTKSEYDLENDTEQQDVFKGTSHTMVDICIGFHDHLKYGTAVCKSDIITANSNLEYLDAIFKMTNKDNKKVKIKEVVSLILQVIEAIFLYSFQILTNLWLFFVPFLVCYQLKFSDKEELFNIFIVIDSFNQAYIFHMLFMTRNILSEICNMKKTFTKKEIILYHLRDKYYLKIPIMIFRALPLYYISLHFVLIKILYFMRFDSNSKHISDLNIYWRKHFKKKVLIVKNDITVNHNLIKGFILFTTFYSFLYIFDSILTLDQESQKGFIQYAVYGKEITYKQLETQQNIQDLHISDKQKLFFKIFYDNIFAFLTIGYYSYLDIFNANNLQYFCVMWGLVVGTFFFAFCISYSMTYIEMRKNLTKCIQQGYVEEHEILNNKMIRINAKFQEGRFIMQQKRAESMNKYWGLCNKFFIENNTSQIINYSYYLSKMPNDQSINLLNGLIETFSGNFDKFFRLQSSEAKLKVVSHADLNIYGTNTLIIKRGQKLDKIYLFFHGNAIMNYKLNDNKEIFFKIKKGFVYNILNNTSKCTITSFDKEIFVYEVPLDCILEKVNTRLEENDKIRIQKFAYEFIETENEFLDWISLPENQLTYGHEIIDHENIDVENCMKTDEESLIHKPYKTIQNINQNLIKTINENKQNPNINSNSLSSSYKFQGKLKKKDTSIFTKMVKDDDIQDIGQEIQKNATNFHAQYGNKIISKDLPKTNKNETIVSINEFGFNPQKIEESITDIPMIFFSNSQINQKRQQFELNKSFNKQNIKVSKNNIFSSIKNLSMSGKNNFIRHSTTQEINTDSESEDSEDLQESIQILFSLNESEISECINEKTDKSEPVEYVNFMKSFHNTNSNKSFPIQILKDKMNQSIQTMEESKFIPKEQYLDVEKMNEIDVNSTVIFLEYKLRTLNRRLNRFRKNIKKEIRELKKEVKKIC